MASPTMLSAPALILTIGHSMLSSMVEVERIYFQSDDRRRSTTRFLALNQHPRTGDVEWNSPKDVPSARGVPCSWKDMYERTQAIIEPLLAGIRSAIHELRSHEKLIEAGLGGKNALPLDVYMVADLSESDAAALLVLMPAIRVLLADEPYAALHLLLNIAAFDENLDSRLNVHVSLNNLHTLLQSQEQFLMPQIYLFDRLKEGIWEAQDKLEVQTILGNFLLALLSGGLAQHVTHQLTQAEMEQHQAYFCGASAVVIVADLEQLQRTCAFHLAQEILENEFLSKVSPDPALIEEIAVNFLAEHANPSLWRLRLCQNTLFHNSLGSRRSELHIHDLHFEDVPIHEWVRTIQAYDERFQTQHLPVQYETVEKNSIELDREFNMQVTEFARSLPRRVNLYPGGVQASRLILEKIRRDLTLRSHELLDESRVEELWDGPIKTSRQWLEDAIGKLPQPPHWISHLPAILKKPVVQLFHLIYLHRDLIRITDLREASLRLLERKYAALMDVKVNAALAQLSQDWETALDKEIRSTRRLQTMLDKLHTSLGKASNEIASTASLFRISAWNNATFAWAYYQGKRPPVGFRHSLLVDWDLLSDWQRMNVRTLEERLMNFCLEAYDSLSELDLDELLSHHNRTNAGDFVMALSQGTIPLLRPNFDQTGSGPSYQLRFYLSRDPRESPLHSLLRNDTQEWQALSTGDPGMAICCRVRVMLPITSIRHILERGKGDYGALGDKMKKHYFLMEGK